MASNANKAFDHLEQATAAGYDNVEHLQNDTDLTALHADRRWQPLVTNLKEAVAKADAHVNQALAAMRRTDQGIRLKMDSIEKNQVWTPS